MFHYHFYQWLSFFYFYCMMGWCFESAYVSLKQRRFVNRGFLKGPWLPLYGSGAILVLLLTIPFQETPWAVWLAGSLGATALEYVTGEAMVRLFKVRYWDYSNQHFQYKGHICLSSSVAWGFLSMLMVYVLQPASERFLFWLNGEAVSVGTFAVTVLMVYDFAGAFRQAMDLRRLLEQADQVMADLEQKALQKKRLLDAAAVFAKHAVNESIADKKEALAQYAMSVDAFVQAADRLSQTKEYASDRLNQTREYASDWLSQTKEQFMERLERETLQLEERQEQLKAMAAERAERFLTHNPGAAFMTRGIGKTAEIREYMRNRREKGER
ncbi:MAG: hypothetical protein Q4C82_04990 [Eubacteriales bacterium]|nr:hypothetical protein [Eubacteriales bacterium]